MFDQMVINLRSIYFFYLSYIIIIILVDFNIFLSII